MNVFHFKEEMKYISFMLLFIIICLSCKSPLLPDKSTLILVGDQKDAIDNLVHSIDENAKSGLWDQISTLDN